MISWRMRRREGRGVMKVGGKGGCRLRPGGFESAAVVPPKYASGRGVNTGVKSPK